MNIQQKVTYSGPFFTGSPSKTFYENLGDMLDQVAGEMEGMARSEISSHEGQMPYSIGWTEAHTFGYTRSPKTGKVWATWAAVGVPTTGMGKEQAIRTKAAAASIERRFHVFRNVKSAVYRMRALLRADLTKGMN